MQYDKKIIDMYIIIYHLNINNIHNVIETNFNIINRFLTLYILISLNSKSIKISKQLQNFGF